MTRFRGAAALEQFGLHASNKDRGAKPPLMSEEASMKKLLMALAMCLAMYGIISAAVNINTATKEELTSLKGIGEKRAQAIINYRTKNGPFKTVDDLEKVPGIGPGLMKQIRPQITTTGKTITDKSPDDTKPTLEIRRK
jgi:competence protein ComEA